MIAAWPGAAGEELAIAFDKGRSRRVLVLPAWFDEGNKLRHFTVEVMRRLDGSYVLEPAPGGRGTHVTYHLSVDLIIPLPGFVKRRAETKIIHTALRELRSAVEG